MVRNSSQGQILLTPCLVSIAGRGRGTEFVTAAESVDLVFPLFVEGSRGLEANHCGHWNSSMELRHCNAENSILRSVS